MISFRHKGDFSKLTSYLEKVKEAARMKILNQYGAECVAALASATPVKTGLTANSWNYEVSSGKDVSTITLYNSNSNKGVNIAVILQYGHGTGTGGWVEGRDYINPSIQPIFDKIVEQAWEEVTRI